MQLVIEAKLPILISAHSQKIWKYVVSLIWRKLNMQPSGCYCTTLASALGIVTLGDTSTAASHCLTVLLLCVGLGPQLAA